MIRPDNAEIMSDRYRKQGVASGAEAETEAEIETEIETGESSISMAPSLRLLFSLMDRDRSAKSSEVAEKNENDVLKIDDKRLFQIKQQ